MNEKLLTVRLLLSKVHFVAQLWLIVVEVVKALGRTHFGRGAANKMMVNEAIVIVLMLEVNVSVSLLHDIVDDTRLKLVRDTGIFVHLFYEIVSLLRRWRVEEVDVSKIDPISLRVKKNLYLRLTILGLWLYHR